MTAHDTRLDGEQSRPSAARQLCFALLMTASLAAAALGPGCAGSSPAPCLGVQAPVVSGQRVTAPDGSSAVAQEYDDPMQRLSRLPGSSFVEILEVRALNDGRVLFCSGVRGLNVIDATEPLDMVTLRQLSASLGSNSYPRCQHLALDGDVVYASNRGDEIQSDAFIAAWDIHSGQELAIVTDPSLSFEGLAAQQGMVYAAAHGAGLVVYERQGGELLRRGSLDDLGNAWAVAVAGSTAYVADADGALHVIDVSNADAPARLGSVNVGGTPQSIEIDAARNVAFVAAGADGVISVDVSTAAAPVVLDELDTPGLALQIALDGERALVADWNEARLLDIRDPSALRSLAKERIELEQTARVLGASLRGGVAYLGEWTGLYAYGLADEVLAPDIRTDEQLLDFGQLDGDERAARALIVRNEGTAPLVSWQIRSSDPSFSVTPSSLLLEPGEAAAVEVQLRAGGGEQSSCLSLLSDDPDQGAWTVALHANRPELSVGDEAPEVSAQLLGGGSWSLADQRGEVVVLAYFATF